MKAGLKLKELEVVRIPTKESNFEGRVGAKKEKSHF